MSEIPHDIREAAAKALNEAEGMIGTLFSDRLEVVARAILAERQRCAGIAYRVCAETRHVTLGDKARDAINATGGDL